MKSLKLLKEFRERFVRVHAFTIVIVSILELVGYVVLLQERAILPSWKEAYLWYGVLFPIVANIMIHATARIMIFVLSINEELKNAAIIYAALATSVVVSICHRDFIIASCSFVFPMVLSTIFNDRKLLNQSVQITGITYVILVIVLFFEKNITMEQNLNIIILFGFMAVAYLCASISVRYSEKNMQIINKQESANERLKDQVRHDGMTGLYNHHAFYDILESALKFYHSDGIKVSLAMIDIDDFKDVNDTYGHENGDAVIMTLSEIMKKHCVEDKVCRYGGEEFGIIFLDKDYNDVLKTVHEILWEFSNSKFDFGDTSFTFSCGLSEYDGTLSVEGFFADADRKMYKAKHNGKNMIVE